MAETVLPDSGLALHIAQYHLARRRLDAAHTALVPALATPPQAPRERQALADTLAALAQLEITRRALTEAAATLASAQSLAQTPAVHRANASLAAALGQGEAAVRAWRLAAQGAPDDGATWLGLARACERASDAAGAEAAYLRAARRDPTHATMLTVAERLAALVPAADTLPAAQRVRVAFLGSSTLDHLRSYVEVACRQAGLVAECYVGPFGQYAQEILQPASDLYAFAPDVVVLAVHGRALFPDLYDAPFEVPVAERRASVQGIVDQMAGLLSQLTSRTSALVLLHTFGTPQYSPISSLDLRDEFGQTAFFQALNERLAERVRRDYPSVRLIEEDRVYGRIGKQHVTDARMWYLARIGIGEGALGALADEYLRFIKPLKGRARKCLVLDLDNTLWGGVVGEDGPHGIALGQEAPGNAYRAFQEAILALAKRGVILAIVSKNNEADAMEVLEHHPDMVLRPQHFAALRINWIDKATNLRSIAEELNIGLDSLVFVDDNPAECALVRERLPEVLTVELPDDPARYRAMLLSLTDFESLTLTEEDRQRGQLYAQRRERQKWEAAHEPEGAGLGDYLADLGLVVELAEADEFAIPRVAQLMGKTNQFNVTTRRHGEAAVRAFAAAEHARVYSARVRDRFGDHGLVGVAILTREEDNTAVWEIDSLLLSCRVLGRGVETALLSALAAEARSQGGTILRGIFIPTAKNTPAREVYGSHGFVRVGEREGGEVWELDLRTSDVALPTWLTLELHAPVQAHQ